MHEYDNVLVLSDSHENNLVFKFRSKLWAGATLVLGSGIFLGAFFLPQEMKSFDVSRKMFFLFGFLMAVFSLLSLFINITLELNVSNGKVEYLKKTLFGKTQWKKSFGEFEHLRIIRPKRKSFCKILLVLKDGQAIPLGTSEAGIYGSDNARGLAKTIGNSTNLPIIEDPAVTRRV